MRVADGDVAAKVKREGKSNRPMTSLGRCREHVVPCYFRGRRAENDIEERGRELPSLSWRGGGDVDPFK